MSIRYRSLSSGPDSQRQHNARIGQMFAPPPAGVSRVFSALAEAGTQGLAVVTGIALALSLGSVTAKGRGQVDVSSFLSSTPTLGQVVGRGRSLASPNSFFIVGSLSSVPARGRGKISETGFGGVTPTTGTVTAKGRALIQAHGGFSTGFSTGFATSLASFTELAQVIGRGRAYVAETGLSQTKALGIVGAVGGSGNSGRAFVTGQVLWPTMGQIVSGFSSGFDPGYGSHVAALLAAQAKGRALTEIVGLEQFGFLGDVTMENEPLEIVPPFFASLWIGPVFEGDPGMDPALEAALAASTKYEADVGAEPVLGGDPLLMPVLAGEE